MVTNSVATAIIRVNPRSPWETTVLFLPVALLDQAETGGTVSTVTGRQIGSLIARPN